MVKCSDDTIYTGYTNNLFKRINQHNMGKQGARYTRNKRPVKLVYIENCSSQIDAIHREKEIKNLSREKKLKLIDSFLLEIVNNVNYERDDFNEKIVNNFFSKNIQK